MCMFILCACAFLALFSATLFNGLFRYLQFKFTRVYIGLRYTMLRLIEEIHFVCMAGCYKCDCCATAKYSNSNNRKANKTNETTVNAQYSQSVLATSAYVTN